MSRPFPTLLRWIAVFSITAFGLLFLAVWTGPARSGPPDASDDPIHDEAWDEDPDAEIDPGPFVQVRDLDYNRGTVIDDTDLEEFQDPVDGDTDGPENWSASRSAEEIGGFHCTSAPTAPAWAIVLLAGALLRRRRA